MKTLVIQLARLGDIYQTWPVLRAMNRVRGAGDEIHLLTRESFSGATDGLDSEVDTFWTLDTKNILNPIVSENLDTDESLVRISAWVENLREQEFDRVINLSFSPFSSRLVAAISGPQTLVSGYSRYADGYLSIPDDASAYFYAQAGTDRMSRVHVTELFAQVAGVELQSSDWRKAPKFSKDFSNSVHEAFACERSPIVLHLGASQAEKTYPSHKWQAVARTLSGDAQIPVVLIGSKAEQELAEAVKAAAPNVVNLVGRTHVRDLFAIIGNAELLIGADSAPVHVAALTGTPVLNLSFGTVNFWETGPKSPGSRILAFTSPDDLASDVVVNETISMLQRTAGDARAIRVVNSLVPYQAPIPQPGDYVWEWLQAIYMGQPFPFPEDKLCLQGLMRLNEANQLALEQLAKLEKDSKNQTALLILDRFDEIIDTIAGMVPALGVLVRWFQAERIRIGPTDTESLIARTKALHIRLQDVLSIYQNEEVKNDQLKLG
jgi:heptosyltransferase-3